MNTIGVVFVGLVAAILVVGIADFSGHPIISKASGPAIAQATP